MALMAICAARTPALSADPPAAAPDSADDFRAAAIRRGAGATDADHAGIWKAAVPSQGAMHREFDGNDPVGVAAGVKVKADCSINWVSPDSGRRYCFSSATSLVLFLETPASYLTRATASWERMRADTTPR